MALAHVRERVLGPTVIHHKSRELGERMRRPERRGFRLLAAREGDREASLYPARGSAERRRPCPALRGGADGRCRGPKQHACHRLRHLRRRPAEYVGPHAFVVAADDIDDPIAGAVQQDDRATAGPVVFLREHGDAAQHVFDPHRLRKILQHMPALALQQLALPALPDVAMDEPAACGAGRHQERDENDERAVAEAPIVRGGPGHVDVDFERAAMTGAGRERDIGLADHQRTPRDFVRDDFGHDLLLADHRKGGAGIDGAPEVARPGRDGDDAVGADDLIIAHRARGAGEVENAPVLLADEAGGENLVERQQPRLKELRPMHRRARRRAFQQAMLRLADRQVAGDEGNAENERDRQEESAVAADQREQAGQQASGSPTRGPEDDPAVCVCCRHQLSNRNPLIMSGVT